MRQRHELRAGGEPVVEPAETLTVALANASGATIADDDATGTIENDDAVGNAGTVQFNSAGSSFSESTAGISVNLSRTGGSAGAVQVTVAADAGSTATGGVSCTAGVDFLLQNATVSWADGETGSRSVVLRYCSDAEVEPDETVVLTLTDLTGGATLGTPSTASYTILDDDESAEFPDLAITDVSVDEGDTGTTSAIFRVSLSEASSLSRVRPRCSKSLVRSSPRCLVIASSTCSALVYSSFSASVSCHASVST